MEIDEAFYPHPQIVCLRLFLKLIKWMGELYNVNNWELLQVYKKYKLITHQYQFCGQNDGRK